LGPARPIEEYTDVSQSQGLRVEKKGYIRHGEIQDGRMSLSIHYFLSLILVKGDKVFRFLGKSRRKFPIHARKGGEKNPNHLAKKQKVIGL